MARGSRAEAPAVNQAGELRSARVESLRALAAAGVVVAHVYGASHRYEPVHGVPGRVVASGAFSVYLFFVLSGYLLFWPFARRAFGDGEPIDVRRYAVNRGLRILPLYYVAVVVYLLVRAHGGTLEQWALFGTFGENFSNSTVLKVNPAMWSLVVELHFYVLLPFLAILLGRIAPRSLRRAAVAVAVLGGASFAFRYVTLYGEPTPNRYLLCSLPSCFPFFSVGMLLALVRLSWERRRPRLLAGPLGAAQTWVLGAALLWLPVAFAEKTGYLAGVASFLLVGACVLPLRPAPVMRALDWRPLAAVGVASYSLYLWHVLIVRELVERLDLYAFAALLAIAVPVCLGVAFLSYAVVERPFLRLRRRWGSTAVSDLARRRTGGRRPASFGR